MIDLFYIPVSVEGQATLKGMLDSGTMSCTLNVETESTLKAAGVLLSPESVSLLLVVVLQHSPVASMT